MRWVWRGFCAGLPPEGATGIHEDEFEGRPLRVRWTRLTPAARRLLPAADRTRSPPRTRSCPRHEQPALELGLPPAPRALPVSRLSYSGLEAYRRQLLPLQRSLGLAPPRRRTAARRGERRERHDRPAARLDRPRADRAARLRRPLVPSDEEIAAELERFGIERLPADVADLLAMVERVAGSQLRGASPPRAGCAPSCRSRSR